MNESKSLLTAGQSHFLKVGWHNLMVAVEDVIVTEAN